jgi:acyl carrier protein
MALDVDRRIRGVLERIVRAAAEVDSASNLAQVKGWDSLAALRVLVALEREFGIVLPHHLFGLHPTIESVTPVILAGVAARGWRSAGAE